MAFQHHAILYTHHICTFWITVQFNLGIFCSCSQAYEEGTRIWNSTITCLWLPFLYWSRFPTTDCSIKPLISLCKPFNKDKTSLLWRNFQSHTAVKVTTYRIWLLKRLTFTPLKWFSQRNYFFLISLISQREMVPFLHLEGIVYIKEEYSSFVSIKHMHQWNLKEEDINAK